MGWDGFGGVQEMLYASSSRGIKVGDENDC